MRTILFTMFIGLSITANAQMRVANSGKVTLNSFPLIVGDDNPSENQYRFVTFYDGSMNANTKYVNFGKSSGMYNCGELAFTHISDNNSSNYTSLGLYGSSQRLVVQGDGKVGIGTYSPTQTLTVDSKQISSNAGIPALGGTTQNGIMRLQVDGDSWGEALDFGMNVSPTYAWIQATNRTDLSIKYSLILNPNGGNVGIGTSTPSESLQLGGNIRGNVNGALSINSGNGTLTIGAQNNGWAHIYTDRDAFIFNKPITLYNGAISAYVDSYSHAYDISFKTDNAQQMIVTGYGCVGIHTTTPAYELDVSGVVRAGSFTTESDERLKDSIKGIENAFTLLSKVKGVRYRLKPNGMESLAIANSNKNAKSDTLNVNTNLTKTKLPKKDSALYNHRHIGVLAQDLQTVFPDLVYTDSNGILSVDYAGLIPVIIEAIKEQGSQIEKKDSLVIDQKKQLEILQTVTTAQEQSIINLQKQIDDLKKNCCSSKTKSTSASEIQTSTISTDIALYQNAPNPFTQTTEIKYYIPETVKSATLYIFNMQGTMIKNSSIGNSGVGSITIYGSELKAGMYLYSLIADGKEVDTKRMILTE